MSTNTLVDTLTAATAVNVQSGGTIQVAGSQISQTNIVLSGFKAVRVTGISGAGALTTSPTAGVVVGMRVIFTSAGHLDNTTGLLSDPLIPGTDIEAAITVSGQIQQKNTGNLTGREYTVYLAPALV